MPLFLMPVERIVSTNVAAIQVQLAASPNRSLCRIWSNPVARCLVSGTNKPPEAYAAARDDLCHPRQQQRLVAPFLPASSAGIIGLPGAILLNRRRALLPALFFCCALAHAQTIAFELQTHPDSPIALVNYTPSIFRIQSDRRQFLTREE